MSDTASSQTGPITFSDATARHQLRSHEEVVTFRSSQRTTGKTWWRITRTGPKMGDVTVTEIGVVDPEDDAVLGRYLDLSGFGSVAAWRSAIRELNGSIPESGYLYRAEVR